MKWKKCGHEIETDAYFWPKCGNGLLEEAYDDVKINWTDFIVRKEKGEMIMWRIFM